MRWTRVGLLLAVGTACATTPRRLVTVEMPSPAMDRAMEVAVYLPPDWTPEERLPLVVFLHGGGDSPGSFDRYEVGEALDAVLESEAMPRVIVAVPQGDRGMWTNWFDRSRMYEDWVVRDLIPGMQERYNTLPCPAGCHLAGVSMGGAGALRMAHHHRDRFATVASLSGIVLSAEEVVAFARRASVRLFVPVKRIFGPLDDPDRLAADDLYRQWTRPEDVPFRLFVGWGTQDSEDVADTSRRFSGHLERSGIPHQRLIFEGRHRWADWRTIIPGMIRWAMAPDGTVPGGIVAPGPDARAPIPGTR